MDMAQLQQITALKLHQSEAKLSGILAREKALRSDLARLQRMAHETQAMPQDQASMRAIGADVIWLRWVSEASRQISIELAQVLAQKDGLMSAHKRAVGKDAVAQELASQNRAEVQKKHRQKALKQAIDRSLIK